MAARQRYWRKYGITNRQYDLMLNLQRGGCWICRRPPAKRRLAVDHCHKTGRVRGLLCFRCNRGVRWFDENPGRLRRAAAYLELTFDGRKLNRNGGGTGVAAWVFRMKGDYVET